MPPASWCVRMRNVVVTGGSRGLGLSMVRTLAAAGYRVIAVARKAGEELSEAMRAAQEANVGAIEFCACDLSDLSQRARLGRSIKSEVGPLYGLVNNAGLVTIYRRCNRRDPDI